MLRKKSKLTSLFIGIIFSILQINPVWASHYRGGFATWKKTSSDTIRFEAKTFWREDNPNNPSFNFGTGSSILSSQHITTTTGAGYAFVETTYTVQFSDTSERTVFFNSSARINTLENNAGGTFRLESNINPASSNNSPLVFMPPVIGATNTSSWTFSIPSIELDPGDTVGFRLGTAGEFSSNGIFDQPGGLSVSITGLLSWDTSDTATFALGNLYSAAVMAEDGDAHVPMDFIIEIRDSSNAAPTITNMSPIDGTVTAIINITTTFSVTATDQEGGILTYTILTPIPHLTSIQVGTTLNLSFTPDATQAGNTYIVFMQITDDADNTVFAYFTVIVPEFIDGDVIWFGALP